MPNSNSNEATAQYFGFSVQPKLCFNGRLWVITDENNKLYEILYPKNGQTHPAVFETRTDALWFLNREETLNHNLRAVCLANVKRDVPHNTFLIGNMVTINWHILPPPQ